MKIGVLISILRQEEKLLLNALHARQVAFDLIDVREVVFNLNDVSHWEEYDCILDRCVSHSQGLEVAEVARTCGDEPGRDAGQ